VLRDGRGTLILIEGAAGIGKSALARAASARALEAGMKSTVGRCYERGIAPPYGPWADIFGDLATAGTGTGMSLPEPFGGETPAFSRHQLAG